MLEISFQKAPTNSTKCIFLDQNLQIAGAGPELKEDLPVVRKFLEAPGKFDGKLGSLKTLSVLIEDAIVNVVLIGVGKLEDISRLKAQELGTKTFAHLTNLDVTIATCSIERPIGSIEVSSWNASFAYGALLASYKFDVYKSEKKDNNLSLHFDTMPMESEAEFDKMRKVAQATFFARDCINCAPNELYPEEYARRIQNEFSGLPSVEVEIWSEARMKAAGMGGILAVGMGSARESQLVIVKYNGADTNNAPIALLGKGVTFDTGGISLKPASNMDKMKSDMAGAASVLGATKALAMQKAPINLVCIAGLVENMPGGKAQRPGDVITMYSGKTVEVLNTDAEGRLVLGDLLWYAHSTFAPKLMVDVATLTGAILIALGSTYAGAFSNDAEALDRLRLAGEATGELVWPMPLHDDYDKLLSSQVADLANIGQSGEAGSCTAAQFLKNFVGETKWIHLDIAGVAFGKGGQMAKSATGFGIALLCQFIENFVASELQAINNK